MKSLFTKASSASYRVGFTLGFIHLVISWFVIIGLATSEPDAQWQLIWVFFLPFDLPFSVINFLPSYYLPHWSFIESLPYPISSFKGFILPSFVHGIIGPLWYFFLPVCISSLINRFCENTQQKSVRFFKIILILAVCLCVILTPVIFAYRHFVSFKAKHASAAEVLKQAEKASAEATSDRDKFYQLEDLARLAYKAGELKKAENYANELLAKAVQYRDHWNYGGAIHHGNLILGRIALKSGDLEKAKQYLIEAGKTPGSPGLDTFGPNMALAKELLEKNEREVVIQYFELCGKFWKLGQDKLENWTALVQEGKIPDFGANLVY
jgi:hypothetical protein